MGNGPRYKTPLKRRMLGKTDYYQRREMLKSGTTRAVVRKKTKNLSVQFINAEPNGDKTLSTTHSRQLMNYGWNVTGGNIPAAYLTGYLAGKKALKAGIDEAIADLGLQVTPRGGRLYAAIKGMIDAGVSIPVNEEVFPKEDVINGSHIKMKSEHLQENNKDELKKFTKYKSAKVKPQALDKSMKKVIKAIDSEE